MSGPLYIIDTFSLLFQVYHAIPPMTGPSGQPTNATFGFTRDLLTILRNKQPEFLMCAFDLPGPGKRNEVFEDYKANRDEMPADLVPQISMVEQIIQGFGIPVLGCPGWEADDVIATVVAQANAQDIAVNIVTSDKDARQLLNPNVRLYNVRKDTFLDEEYLMKDWGIRPDQVIDFQALVGDSVDNVPGVPLVGPKKASNLLAKFGTLDEVLANPDEAPGPKLRENLKTYADQALMSRILVTLKNDLPITVDWDAARVSGHDIPQLTELFREYGFRRFGEEVRSLPGNDVPPTKQQGALFGGADPTWEVVDTAEKFETFLSELREQSRFCVDLETTGLNEMQADIVGWAFSWKANSGHYLPVMGPDGQQALDAEQVSNALRPILEDPKIEISNQNIKYDMLVMRRVGIRLEGIGVDPMVGSYLLDAGARSHGLDALAEKYLHHRMIPISDLIGSGKDQKSMAEVDIEKAAEYAAEDADISLQLADLIAEELRREDLWDLYWELERPLIPVLADMEFQGIRVDAEELERQSSELTARLEQLVGEIYEMAGHEFNIDSPLQLRTVLFDELDLPVQKKTKTGPSTDQSVLEKLALLHPLPAKISEHRHLSKLKSTYLDSLPTLIDPDTQRIHASFNQVVAATGRLSSSNPNLQNIPIRTEEGRRVRKAFVPSEPGWKLLCADYSQIELRMLAHFCGDIALTTAFADNVDIHSSVAAEIFDVDDSEVDSQMRRVAKAVNFGVIYGQSSFGLAAALGIDRDQAAEFIDNYFARFSGVEQFLEEILDECASSGYARTIRGRRRAIAGIRRDRPSQRNMPERTAINTVIQGSAADLIKQAMINVHARLAADQHPARTLLQIHDELVFECPADEIGSLADLVREEMEQAMKLDVPLAVDIAVGDNWHDVASFNSSEDQLDE